MARYYPENWEDTGEYSSYELRSGVDWDEVCRIEEEENDIERMSERWERSMQRDHEQDLIFWSDMISGTACVIEDMERLLNAIEVPKDFSRSEIMREFQCFYDILDEIVKKNIEAGDRLKNFKSKSGQANTNIGNSSIQHKDEDVNREKIFNKVDFNNNLPINISHSPIELKTLDRIHHKTFGEGVVKKITPVGNDALLEIAFSNVGNKKLMLRTASKFMKVIAGEKTEVPTTNINAPVEGLPRNEEKNGKYENAYCYLTKERKVTELIHFTPLDNLKSILVKGILPRNLLPEGTTVTDMDRMDQMLDYSCFSISCPNTKLLFKKRNSLQKEFVILSIDPKIIKDKDISEVKFYKKNAAGSTLGETGVTGASKLFANNEKTKPDLPLQYPVDVQAEVLIKGTVSADYIKCIYVRDYRMIGYLKEIIGEIFNREIKCDPVVYYERDME